MCNVWHTANRLGLSEYGLAIKVSIHPFFSVFSLCFNKRYRIGKMLGYNTEGRLLYRTFIVRTLLCGLDNGDGECWMLSVCS